MSSEERRLGSKLPSGPVAVQCHRHRNQRLRLRRGVWVGEGTGDLLSSDGVDGRERAHQPHQRLLRKVLVGDAAGDLLGVGGDPLGSDGSMAASVPIGGRGGRVQERPPDLTG